MKDDHAESLGNEAVSGGHANENAQNNKTMSHENTADDSCKEAMDENGEEIVEAAEDTVIY